MPAEIWGVAIAAVGAAYGAYSENQAQGRAEKNRKELDELGFNRERWLAEQQRAYKLQDRQYVEDSIGGFRGFAPDYANSFNGQPVTPPQRTSTEGLMDFDPNQRAEYDALFAC